MKSNEDENEQQLSDELTLIVKQLRDENSALKKLIRQLKDYNIHNIKTMSKPKINSEDEEKDT